MIMKKNFFGITHQTAKFFEEKQLLDRSLWKTFVEQFREQEDGKNYGWRGEFWGKMMRGAVTVYQYTDSQNLCEVMTETVEDMLTVAEEDGRVSTYTRDTEFDAWDLWCRKYVLLGMEYYLEICKDPELKNRILKFLSRSADYIVKKIGDGEGQKKITKASRSWLGINSSSILEPMVRLYRMTQKQEYLDFCTYIVKNGGADGINIFEKALENRVFPYQYGVSKAYEMISCFEGLLEYYEATKIEKYKQAAINFGYAVMNSDVTVIGTCGCTHELFDHSRVRQTAYYEGIMQETCVTVTWMKYCAKLFLLTGDSKFADCMEKSFYNAYLGSINTEERECPYICEKFIRKMKYPRIESVFLPVDSYSPLLAGSRGEKVGGTQIFSNLKYYGCCTAIAAAGVGVFLGQAAKTMKNGIEICFFEKGVVETEWNGKKVTIEIKTEYPKNGALEFLVRTEEPVSFDLRVRIPDWSSETVVDSKKKYAKENGFLVFSGEWSGESRILVNYGMKLQATYPFPWEQDEIWTDMTNLEPGNHLAKKTTVYHKPEEDRYISLSRGPLVLCGIGGTDQKDDPVWNFEAEIEDLDCLVFEQSDDQLISCRISDGVKELELTDYASAGKNWKHRIAAWLPTQQTKGEIK